MPFGLLKKAVGAVSSFAGNAVASFVPQITGIVAPTMTIPSFSTLGANLKSQAFGFVANRASSMLNNAVGSVTGAITGAVGNAIGGVINNVTSRIPSSFSRAINIASNLSGIGDNLGSIVGGTYTGKTNKDLAMQIKNLVKKSAYNFDKFGEHAHLDKNTNPFNYDMCYYPEEVTNMGDGHYLTFDIIVDTKRVSPKQSSFDRQLDSLQYTSFYDSDERVSEDKLYGSSKRKLSKALRNIKSRYNYNDGTSNYAEVLPQGKTTRKIRGMQSGFRSRSGADSSKRIDNTIILGMPNQSHKFSYGATYSADTATGALGDIATQFADSFSAMNTASKFGGFADAVSKIIPAAMPRMARSFLNTVIPSAGVLANISSGFAVNPNMEIAFESVPFREFSFSFDMIPKNRAERHQIEKIIKLFKFHMLPDASAKGKLYVPSEFQITYCYRDSENMFIPLISRCVLSSFSVDYAPESKFATFYGESEGAPPVNYKLDMSFKELEIMTKETIAASY